MTSKFEKLVHLQMIKELRISGNKSKKILTTGNNGFVNISKIEKGSK